jgi:hypothetical protein
MNKTVLRTGGRSVTVSSLLMSACVLNTFGITEGATDPTEGSEEPLTTTTEEGLPTTTMETSEEPATTAAGNCEIAPECMPGDIESGEQCDSCGVQQRTCQDDCTWTPLACEVDLNTCAYWWLPEGAKTWQRFAVDPGASFAPKETVLATVDLQPLKQIYVLTDNNYHVFSTTTKTWIEAGSRDAKFPDIEDPLRTGTSLDGGLFVVSFIAGVAQFRYVYDGMTPDFVFDSEFNFDMDWQTPGAPDNPLTMRDGWSQHGDPEGWMLPNSKAICPPEPAGEPYSYTFYIGDGFVYSRDSGDCYEFYPRIHYSEFKPFTYPGAPAHDLVGGASMLDGLWIFRGE